VLFWIAAVSVLAAVRATNRVMMKTLFGQMTILVLKYRCPKYKTRCHSDFWGFKMYRNVTISAAQRLPGLSLLSQNKKLHCGNFCFNIAVGQNFRTQTVKERHA
jgi:hypothetical protein